MASYGESEFIHGAAVSLNWIDKTLEQIGYQTTPIDPFTLRARHPKRPPIGVRLHPPLRLIAVLRAWQIARGTPAIEVLNAINRANQEAFYGVYFTDPDGDLAVSSRMSLTERMSRGDLAAFLEEDNDEFMRLMKSSGLYDLLA